MKSFQFNRIFLSATLILSGCGTDTVRITTVEAVGAGVINAPDGQVGRGGRCQADCKEFLRKALLVALEATYPKASSISGSMIESKGNSLSVTRESSNVTYTRNPVTGSFDPSLNQISQKTIPRRFSFISASYSLVALLIVEEPEKAPQWAACGFWAGAVNILAGALWGCRTLGGEGSLASATLDSNGNLNFTNANGEMVQISVAQ